jgi:hypothetical protein
LQGAAAAARAMRIISAVVESTLFRMTIKAFVAIIFGAARRFNQHHPRM